MSLSSDTKRRLQIALTLDSAGKEVSDKIDSASHNVVALSLSATISTDTAFAAKLKIGDEVVSWKAASNEFAPVIANGTLPAGISDAAGVTVAIRAAL